MATNNPVDDEAPTQAIRQKLNNEQVKLWLPPYTVENSDEATGVYPEEFLQRYSTELNLPKQTVAEIFERLRRHALAKLASRKNKQETDKTVLKIKMTGEVPVETSSKNCFDVEVNLETSGRELRKRISETTGLPEDYLKLISCGSVIQDELSIHSQHIRHGSQVMAIVLSKTEIEARRQEQQVSKLVKTKEAAAILARKKDGGNSSERDERYFLQIADQTGKAIDLPDSEREALSVALTLNEKGRACLKRRQHGEALLILLEADKAFSQCRSEILNAVDNYAVLCLDIVWCYLCLQNVNEFPNAEAKLKTCEDCFSRSYGDNLQRLASLKGGSSRELALYVRLYLLQGILAFYQHRMDAAGILLQKAEDILSSLQVDEDKLVQVVSMGFDVREARLGLRAAQGDVSSAVIKITEQRQRRKEIREKEAEERKKKKMARKFGKTANGEWVKVDVYETLLSMGFPKQAIIAALKQTNNDVSQAIQAMQDQPDLLMLGDHDAQGPWMGEITSDMVAQVCELGFDPAVARLALQRYRGNVERAVDILIARGGVLPPDLGSSSSSSSGSSSSQTETSDDEEEKLTDEQKQAIADIVPDIPDHEEDYLDLTLEEEAKYIQEYKTRLASLQG